MDVYKFLLLNRVVFVRGYLDDVQTSRVVGSLLALQALDPAEPITLYVNSPGGMFYNVAGVLDTMAAVELPPGLDELIDVDHAQVRLRAHGLRGRAGRRRGLGRLHGRDGARAAHALL